MVHSNQRTGVQSFLCKAQRMTSAFLRRQRDDPILILTADKGQITVAMDKSAYVQKSQQLLSDSSTYSLLNKDPTPSIQNKNNKFVKSLLDSNFIEKSVYSRLVSHNGTLPRYYGVPKVHKQGCPLRPIISFVGSPTYELSSFLAGILSDAFGERTNYNIKDSFNFVDKMRDFVLPPNYVLLSLDVVSLFTNIPLTLVTEIINEKWNLLEDVTPIDKSLLLNIITFLFESSVFVFDGCIYGQKFGTPMGSPLSPVLATIVLDHLLDVCIPKLPFKPAFVYKYVDDVVCSVPEGHINTILTIFNGFDQHLQFTVETEVERSVPFLDTKIIRRADQQLWFDWYTKPTFTGRYINFYSNHPLKQKINTLAAMCKRIKRISHPTLLKKNLSLLHSIFHNNGYPNHLIKGVINSTGSDIHPQTRANPVDEFRYVKIPYIPALTPKLISVLSCNNIRFARYNCLPLGRLFSNTKDPVPALSQSGVVYKIPCGDCEASYIGTTSQYLYKRVNQHKCDCGPDKDKNKNKSALVAHHLLMGHNFDFNGVTILDRERTYTKRMFLEMVHINKEVESINFRTDTEHLSSIYSFLLSRNLPQNQTIPEQSSLWF